MKSVVRVTWKDATSVDEWTSAEEISPECHTIETVGILVAESEEILTVALNHDVSGNSYSCYINIPKAWIVSRRKLRG